MHAGQGRIGVVLGNQPIAQRIETANVLGVPPIAQYAARVLTSALIVEAMAQLSGLLLSRKLEHTGKLPLLLSMDKVKLRRPVVPGDQLVLESENIRVKARTGHVKCRAFVGDQLAAEAIIKFMLVDNDLSAQ